MKLHLLLLILLLAGALSSRGQDIHFSQIGAAPLLLNPALTASSAFDFRAGINYRNQWPNVDKAYITQSAFVDSKIYPAFLGRHDFIGVGGYFFNDKAGLGDLKNSAAALTVAYKKGLNRFNTIYVSVGAAMVLGNKSVDFDKLTFDSQWTDQGFDPSLNNFEFYDNSSVFYLDFHGGLMAGWEVNSRLTLNVGGSLSHINQPRQSFYQDNNRVKMRAVFHASADIRLTDRFMVSPAAYLSDQKINDELVVGADMKYFRKGYGPYVGLWSRLGRDIIATAGVQASTWNIKVSYDMNYGGLFTHRAFEVSVIKAFNYPRNQSPCPIMMF